MSREFSDSRTLHFITQLASTTRAGLPLGRTLKLLQEHEGPASVRRVWTEVEGAIDGGSTFGQALGRQSPPVPSLCVELITAGEESGHLELVLVQLRRYYEMRSSLRLAALGASAYPLFVAFFGFCIWTLLRVITATDKAAALYGMIASLVLLLITVGLVVFFFRRTSLGQALWDGFLLRVPIVAGAMRRLALARFGRTLAMMYSSGLPVPQSLDRACTAAANRFIVRDLQAGAKRVAEGESLASAFGACRYVPARMREMLETGELTGTYDETLTHIAEIYEDEARQVLTNLPKLIAPVMLITIGLLVVYLYYTYYLKPFIIDPINQLM